jgi:hypothetical protein
VQRGALEHEHRLVSTRVGVQGHHADVGEVESDVGDNILRAAALELGISVFPCI